MADESTEPVDFSAEVDQNISRNLRRARESRGWSQAELAQHVSEIGVPGFHQTTIARIEGGTRPLRASEAIAICRSLEITLEWLAESAVSAELRSESSWLSQKSKEFDEAAQALIHARRLAAMHQDGRFPYGAEGAASIDEVIRSGADPHLYEIVEQRIVSAAPHERLETAYMNELHDARLYRRPPGAEHKSRLEFVAEDMREWLERGDDGVDQATS
ncbi:helix-turn-helix transcriptional regulator [Microbacterium aurum]|uniref:helix-turn-helix transcriptional regulator n=1 Tax=Microbacterium aurum TaxID=36805 RepID=UPI0028E3315E|nr:helix-turn-helix transcriptional regulator [Microbacterium aurum]